MSASCPPPITRDHSPGGGKNTYGAMDAVAFATLFTIRVSLDRGDSAAVVTPQRARAATVSARH